MRVFLVCQMCFLLLSAPCLAGERCFILYDLDHGKVVLRENPARCAARLSPCSTFKVPLALMAFDQGLLDDPDAVVFRWDAVQRRLADLHLW